MLNKLVRENGSFATYKLMKNLMKHNDEVEFHVKGHEIFTFNARTQTFELRKRYYDRTQIYKMSRKAGLGNILVRMALDKKAVYQAFVRKGLDYRLVEF